MSCSSSGGWITSRLNGGEPADQQNAYFAGIRRSSMTSFSAFAPLTLDFPFTLLACTFTTMRAGFRSPTRTSSDSASASVIVALKRPVLRCFGRAVNIRVKAAWKPRSSKLQTRFSRQLWFYDWHAHRSASSSTNTSSSVTLTTFLPFPRRNSSTLPGVPITISAPVERKRCISCAGEVSEETMSRGDGCSGVESS